VCSGRFGEHDHRDTQSGRFVSDITARIAKFELLLPEPPLATTIETELYVPD
jgi:hypothetical protein